VSGLKGERSEQGDREVWRMWMKEKNKTTEKRSKQQTVKILRTNKKRQFISASYSSC